MTAAFGGSSLGWVVKTHGSVDFAAQLRSAVAAIDAGQRVRRVRTMNDIVAMSSATLRFNATLFGLFAGVALLLAAPGLYGVLSFLVSHRRQEIRTRVVLGASKHDVLLLARWIRTCLRRRVWRRPRSAFMGSRGCRVSVPHSSAALRRWSSRSWRSACWPWSFIRSDSEHARLESGWRLGGRPSQIRGQILAQGIQPTVIGLAGGMLLALPLTRTMASFLLGISPTDALVFVGSAVLLAAVALAAILGPVLQATRVNPANVLRSE
jgi:hypothetical protein